MEIGRMKKLRPEHAELLPSFTESRQAEKELLSVGFGLIVPFHLEFLLLWLTSVGTLGGCIP